MYTMILLAAALQHWERYSAHALAARAVAATLAKGTANHLHVLSVYDYPALPTGYLPTELASRQQEERRRRTDTLMVHKMDAYVAPLRAEGVEVTPILRVGNPRALLEAVRKPLATIMHRSSSLRAVMKSRLTTWNELVQH